MQSLTEIFTDRGLLEKKSGVHVNRRRIFNIREDAGQDIKKLYANLAARIAVEASGIQWPLTTDSPEGAVTFSTDIKQEAGTFELRAEGGLSIKAQTEDQLERASEYMTAVYPYLRGGVTFDTVRDALVKSTGGQINVKAAVIDADTYALKNLTIQQKDKSQLKITGIPAGTSKKAMSSKTYEALRKHGQYKDTDNTVINIKNADQLTPETLMMLTMAVCIDSMEVSYPAVTDKETIDSRRRIRFEQSEKESGIYIQENDIIFRCSPKDMDRCTREYAHIRQKLKETCPIIKELKDVLSLRNDAGQILGFAEAAESRSFTEAEIVTENYTRFNMDTEQVIRHMGNKYNKKISLRKTSDEREIKKWQYSHAWEGKDFINAIKKEVLPKIKKGDKLKITGVLSEDKDIRDSLKEEAIAIIEATGAQIEKAKIYRAFKSGASWIEETVLPELKKQTDTDKIKIKFRYFQNSKGQETFESESAPNYGKHQDNPDKWFDIPTRWLQELFPIDEIISAELGLHTDDIEFARDENISADYTVEALDKTGRVTYKDNFDIKYIEKPYISKYPQIGKVHVTTGWINVTKNGETILDKRIETDTEKIWHTLEKQILPELETYLSSKYTKENMTTSQPLFSRLQLNISMSEIDYDTKIREERVSTTEAMQEDLYFYILDWFKTYGERECGKELDNIGLVFPQIVNAKRKDTAITVTLYDDWQKKAGYNIGKEHRILDHTPVTLKIEQINLHRGTVSLEATMTAAGKTKAGKTLNTLKEYVDEGIIDMNPTFPWDITVKQGSQKTTLHIKQSDKKLKPISRQEKDKIITSTIIDYRQYMQLLDYYRQYRELKIYPMETTYKGKKIYAIEAVKKDESVIYSDIKLRANRITALFNARHHGNEASGQNAAFKLIDKLIEEKSAKKMLDKINVVLLPCENIDGAELHQDIIKDNPKWLSHAARYNAAGFEYRKDYLNKDTKYGESRAIKKLWDQWLFDVMTDNHGFEGHELCQPFSGYISPWYKSFWIPRALYYGYIWYRYSHEGQRAFAEKVQEAVSTAINRDKEIKALNEICAERFYKYAEKWFPEMFNTEKYKDVIFYWIDTAKKQRHCNFSVDNPEITTIDWTTEVADETATGHNLELSIRAHHISDMALMELMYNTPIEYETSVTQTQDGTLTYRKIRKRPLW